MANEEFLSSFASMDVRPKKFPPFERVDKPYINRSVSRKTSIEYIVSASRELVALLKELTCKQCEQNNAENNKFSAKDPPYIAVCGHYVHKDCRYIKKDGILTDAAFHCGCDDRKTKSAKYEMPLSCTVFQEFYSKIEEKGYPCPGCSRDTGDMDYHPRHNVVQIIHEGDGNGRPYAVPQYLCVWCCTRKEKYANYCVKLLPEDSNDEQLDSISRQLSSVDCTLHYDQFPNLQCCSCMEPLIPWTKDPRVDPTKYEQFTKDKEELEHLKCGHIRHEDCHDPGVQKVYCNLCKEQWTVEDAKKKAKVSHLREYTRSKKYYKEKISYGAFECGYCKPNKVYHPMSNEGGATKGHWPKRCVWCTVEGTLDSREKKWKERKEQTNSGKKGHKESMTCTSF